MPKQPPEVAKWLVADLGGKLVYFKITNVVNIYNFYKEIYYILAKATGAHD